MYADNSNHMAIPHRSDISSMQQRNINIPITQSVITATEAVLTSSANKMAAVGESESAESEEDESAFADKFKERVKIRAAATRSTVEVYEVI